MKPSAASILGFGPGHVAHYRGSTIEIAQCVAVNTTFRPVPLCYEDLPVWNDGTAMFRDPENFVLKETSTVVDCKLDYRVHKVGTYFFSQKPDLEKEGEIPIMMQPAELNANDTFSHNFESLGMMILCP